MSRMTGPVSEEDTPATPLVFSEISELILKTKSHHELTSELCCLLRLFRGRVTEESTRAMVSQFFQSQYGGQDDSPFTTLSDVIRAACEGDPGSISPDQVELLKHHLQLSLLPQQLSEAAALQPPSLAYLKQLLVTGDSNQQLSALHCIESLLKGPDPPISELLDADFTAAWQDEWLKLDVLRVQFLLRPLEYNTEAQYIKQLAGVVLESGDKNLVDDALWTLGYIASEENCDQESSALLADAMIQMLQYCGDIGRYVLDGTLRRLWCAAQIARHCSLILSEVQEMLPALIRVLQSRLLEPMMLKYALEVLVEFCYYPLELTTELDLAGYLMDTAESEATALDALYVFCIPRLHETQRLTRSGLLPKLRKLLSLSYVNGSLRYWDAAYQGPVCGLVNLIAATGASGVQKILEADILPLLVRLMKDKFVSESITAVFSLTEHGTIAQIRYLVEELDVLPVLVSLLDQTALAHARDQEHLLLTLYHVIRAGECIKLRSGSGVNPYKQALDRNEAALASIRGFHARTEHFDVFPLEAKTVLRLFSHTLPSTGH